MSGSMTTIPNNFQTITAVFNFLTMRTSNGWNVDVLRTEAEELTSPGVAGKRYREIFPQYPEFDLETLADFTTYDAAVVVARKYISVTHYQVRFFTAVRGVNYLIRNAHVLGVEPVVSPGLTAGSGATPGATAIVTARWRMMASRP